jgi:hypothetical protein
LSANEFFSHQLFNKELNHQIELCTDAERECNVEVLMNLSVEQLHHNQKRILELKEVVDNYGKSLSTIFIIFIIFITIGLLPILWGGYQEIRSKIKLIR